MRLARPTAPVLAALLAAGPALAAKVDVVVLQNGSRVVGEIKSMSRARLELSTDDMGTLRVEWENVAAVTAPEFFEVETMGGRLHFGALRPGSGEGRLEVVSSDRATSLALRDVARIQLVKARFLDRFRGSIDAGASYTSASELLQLDLDAELHYRRPRYELKVAADAVLSRQPDVEDTRRGSLTASWARLFPNRHRLLAQGTLEQNRELGYELRSSVMAGWAYLLARDPRNELATGAGLVLNQEQPVEGAATTNAELTAGFNWASFAYDFPNTEVQVAAFGFLGLSQWGRFRLEASASLRRELVTDLYVTLKAYESYDSAPATAGAEQNDWGLSLGLGYKF